MSEKTTLRRSGEPIEGDRTDWERLRRLTDEQNEANIASDFDSWPLDDQARGYFFHVHPAGNGRWTWELIGRDGRVAARAPEDYESREAAETAALPLKENLKAA
jgi:hypothetical protein